MTRINRERSSAGPCPAGKWKINQRNPRTLCKPWDRSFTEHSKKSLSGETTHPLRSKETPRQYRDCDRKCDKG
ncbi:hypothetical protein KUCAC02_009530 [Chaenocephalus aceratus]|nr:hypothetical protein KUCAC02_009530 [Chaenocephalus aceratus]